MRPRRAPRASEAGTGGVGHGILDSAAHAIILAATSCQNQLKAQGGDRPRGHGHMQDPVKSCLPRTPRGRVGSRALLAASDPLLRMSAPVRRVAVADARLGFPSGMASHQRLGHMRVLHEGRSSCCIQSSPEEVRSCRSPRPPPPPPSSPCLKPPLLLVCGALIVDLNRRLCVPQERTKSERTSHQTQAGIRHSAPAHSLRDGQVQTRSRQARRGKNRTGPGAEETQVDGCVYIYTYRQRVWPASGLPLGPSRPAEPSEWARHSDCLEAVDYCQAGKEIQKSKGLVEFGKPPATQPRSPPAPCTPKAYFSQRMVRLGYPTRKRRRSKFQSDSTGSANSWSCVDSFACECKCVCK